MRLFKDKLGWIFKNRYVTMTNFHRTVLIYDTGSCVELARLLVPKFKKVYYFTPWTSTGFPDFNPRFIGEGIKGVEKVENFWEVADEVDLFIFTDVYDGDAAYHLKSLGNNVVSAFYGAELELDRQGFQEFLKEQGLLINKFTPKMGITKLREYLDDKKNKFIKISNLRGITETTKYENKVVSSSELDDISYRLGDLREEIEFLVQDPIGDENAVEWGWEAFFTGGRFNDTILCGIEVKDAAYYGRFINVKDAPAFVSEVHDKFTEALTNYEYQQHFSTEVRQISKDKSYFSDATCRVPHPPGEAMWYNIENIDEVYQGLATGENVPIKYKHEYIVQVIIHSEFGEDHFISIEIPDKYRENVSLKNYAVVDNVPRIIPQAYKLQEIGSVVAGGATLEEAVTKVKEVIDAIKNRNLSFPVDKLDHIQEEIDKMKKLDIDFF